MYAYFEGTVTMVAPAFVVIEVAGIGYKVYSPKPYRYQVGQKTRIFIEQVVRDTGIQLYGFLTAEDKALFLSLLSVNGIGPKSALAIMAAEDASSLADAIERGETKYLTRFPGIGKKTAAQIILDLKGKLGTYVQKTTPAVPVTSQLQDALLALIALGYTQKEVDRITPELEKLSESSAEAYIKKGLALLLKA